MTKIFFVLGMLLVVPQIVCGAEVTQEILNRLGFYETSKEILLKEGVAWKCGSVDGTIFQYRVSGDILGCNSESGRWLRLITPMSTDLPVTAFGIFMDSNNTIVRQVAVLKQCSDSQQHSFEEGIEPQRKKIIPTNEQVITEQVKKPVQAAIPVRVAKKPIQIQKSLKKPMGISVKVEKPVKKTNVDVLDVASVWQLMSIYQEQTGE